ncbi:MAG: hypothetical protein WAK55_02920 [Xanthobacteraceae bacterium]
MANWKELTATGTPRTIVVNLEAVAAMQRFTAHTEILLTGGHKLEAREEISEIFVPNEIRVKWKGE